MFSSYSLTKWLSFKVPLLADLRRLPSLSLLGSVFFFSFSHEIENWPMNCYLIHWGRWWIRCWWGYGKRGIRTHKSLHSSSSAAPFSKCPVSESSHRLDPWTNIDWAGSKRSLSEGVILVGHAGDNHWAKQIAIGWCPCRHQWDVLWSFWELAFWHKWTSRKSRPSI